MSFIGFGSYLQIEKAAHVYHLFVRNVEQLGGLVKHEDRYDHLFSVVSV